MAKFSMLNFIRTQRAKPPPVEKVDLTGKTVIVIGANAGLGFETTKHFASMNPGRLILACRSESKGNAALESKCNHIDPYYGTGNIFLKE
jgi:FlaA1/EpsC-like NDP-sugar epimerase